MTKQDSPPEVSSDRMPCKPSTKLRYNDFVAGLGLRATYDDALVLLLDLVKREGESDFEAGRRLTEVYKTRQEESPGNHEATPVYGVASLS